MRFGDAAFGLFVFSVVGVLFSCFTGWVGCIAHRGAEALRCVGLGEVVFIWAGVGSILAGAGSILAGASSISAGVSSILAGASSISAGVSSILAGASFISAGASSILAGVNSILVGDSSISAGANSILAGTGSILADVFSRRFSLMLFADLADFGEYYHKCVYFFVDH